MKVILNISRQHYRIWQYYLRKRYNTKAKFENIITRIVKKEVSLQAEKELKERCAL
jgi:hypothetical protein